MTSDRYASNVAALGESIASKLQSLRVSVKGDSAVAQAVIYNLIGLGVGSIAHLSNDGRLGPGILRDLACATDKSDASLDDVLFHVAPQVDYSRTGSHTASGDETIAETDFHIDATVNDAPYNNVSSLVIGTLLADECRKYAGLLSKYEQRLSSDDCIDFRTVAFAADIPKIFHRAANSLVPKKFDRVLVVGAGGLGTYCSYILAQRNVGEIIICDADRVEEKNLNRQLFYANSIGRYKATTLAQRLSRIAERGQSASIVPIIEYFTSTLKHSALSGTLDAIFCCTDSIESRIAVSDYAYAHNVPLVDGGCTPTMGCITTYIPRKTASIAVQRDLHGHLRLANIEREKKMNESTGVTRTTRASCTQVANPSIISPNILIGCLQALALDSKLTGDSASITTSSTLIDEYPQINLNLLRNHKFTRSM